MGLQSAMLGLAKASGGFAASRLITKDRLRVLAYHGLWITPGHQFGDRLFMEPQQFEQRMRWLKKSKYKVVCLQEGLDALEKGTLPPNCVVITIDDGWESTYTYMLPVLESLQLPATLYVTTWYVENRAPVLNVALRYVLERTSRTSFTWPADASPIVIPPGNLQGREQIARKLSTRLDEIRPFQDRVRALQEICEILDVPTEPWWSNRQFHVMEPSEVKDASTRGLDVQLHTHRHSFQVATLAKEIDDNRDFLSKECGITNLHHFCYPTGNFDNAACSILASAGIRSAVTCEEALASRGTDNYQVPRFLDGRSITQTKFEAYLSGALDLYRNLPRSWGKPRSLAPLIERAKGLLRKN